MTVTYLDTGVQIAVTRGQAPLATHALQILDDPRRTFVASTFLRLELLPKAVYHRNTSEIDFLAAFFRQVARWAEPRQDVVGMAEDVAARYGLNALDALHVAAAVMLDVDELITTENRHKPVHRVTELHIVTI